MEGKFMFARVCSWLFKKKKKKTAENVIKLSTAGRTKLALTQPDCKLKLEGENKNTAVET